MQGDIGCKPQQSSAHYLHQLHYLLLHHLLLNFPFLQVYPLYGNLPPEKQRLAIAPSSEGERKIVLATPIAETSLTIEGVRIVVDSGLCRKLVYDARTGLSHLETVTISKDMATQRRGRAGRVAEGICYRLWTQTSEHLMEDQRRPEIEEADLTSMVLDIAAFGETIPSRCSGLLHHQAVTYSMPRNCFFLLKR